MKKLSTQKVIIIGIASLGIIGLAVGVAYLHQKKPAVSTVMPSSTDSTSTTSPAADSTSKKSTTGSGTAQATTSSPAGTTATSANPHQASALAKPYGQLLNVSTASIGSNTSLESACNSVIGATCDIRLTMGSTTLYVGSKAVDDNGGAIFDWRVNSSPTVLTAGTWTVVAVATANGQTAVSDPEYLTVNQ